MLPTETRHCGTIFLIFLRLGLTSFGGPVAHLAFFHAEFVTRRRWLSERSYLELVALCQFLPGPASSQVGMALGLSRAGYRGALAAWAGFTLPSALLMTWLGLSLVQAESPIADGVLRGLKIAAVAVVAQAVCAMARQHCASPLRACFMGLGCVAALLMPYAWTQLLVITAAALVGASLFRPATPQRADAWPVPLGRSAGALWLAAFLLLLSGLPILNALYASPALALVEAFYRVGALVFGGGHVVLPLLQSEVVSSGWIAPETFVAGYGAAQAMPGPLFTFAAFIGAALQGGAGGWAAALLCLLAIFAPSFLLLAGVLPFWAGLRQMPRMQAALVGVNATVVGLLLAAFFQPVWSSAVHTWQDVLWTLLAFLALTYAKRAPWQVVAASAGVGWLTG
ncbi:chromate efflux transporter [Pseudomonas sp. v388]|nr:chromate efflux transporter [Pseudomonas sp. v388]RRV07965.1 chromate efflux transporter [Pseudomonas sp. v388]